MACCYGCVQPVNKLHGIALLCLACVKLCQVGGARLACIVVGLLVICVRVRASMIRYVLVCMLFLCLLA